MIFDSIGKLLRKYAVTFFLSIATVIIGGSIGYEKICGNSQKVICFPVTHSFSTTLTAGTVSALYVTFFVNRFFDRLDSQRRKAQQKLSERLQLKVLILGKLSDLDRMIFEYEGRKDSSEIMVCFKWSVSFLKTLNVLYENQGDINDHERVGVIPQDGKRIISRVLEDCQEVDSPDIGDLRCVRSSFQKLAGTLEFE